MMNTAWTPFRELHVLEADFLGTLVTPEACSTVHTNIVNGDIYIIREILSKDAIDPLLRQILSSSCTSTTDPRVLEGVPNIRYSSAPDEGLAFTSGSYVASDHSYYFFPWNPDDLNLFASLKYIYEPIIRLNNYSPSVILRNTPKDRAVLRIHLIHYPLNTGKISLHVDPTNLISVNAGVYLSEYGSDYHSGGFYVVDSDSRPRIIDEFVGRGDLVLFSPNLAHGVEKVAGANHLSKHLPGRYFLHISIVESHEFPDRARSIGISLDPPVSGKLSPLSSVHPEA